MSRTGRHDGAQPEKSRTNTNKERSFDESRSLTAPERVGEDSCASYDLSQTSSPAKARDCKNLYARH